MRTKSKGDLSVAYRKQLAAFTPPDRAMLVLETLLQVPAPPIYCVVSEDWGAVRADHEMGPALEINPVFAKAYMDEGDQVVRWEQAWRSWVRDILPTLDAADWVAKVNPNPPPVYCAVSVRGGKWAETLGRGPYLSVNPSFLVDYVGRGRERFSAKAVEWTEAWPQLRDYVLNNYHGQEEMDWVRLFIENARAKKIHTPSAPAQKPTHGRAPHHQPGQDWEMGGAHNHQQKICEGGNDAPSRNRKENHEKKQRKDEGRLTSAPKKTSHELQSKRTSEVSGRGLATVLCPNDRRPRPGEFSVSEARS